MMPFEPKTPNKKAAPKCLLRPLTCQDEKNRDGFTSALICGYSGKNAADLRDQEEITRKVRRVKRGVEWSGVEWSGAEGNGWIYVGRISEEGGGSIGRTPPKSSGTMSHVTGRCTLRM